MKFNQKMTKFNQKMTKLNSKMTKYENTRDEKSIKALRMRQNRISYS